MPPWSLDNMPPKIGRDARLTHTGGPECPDDPSVQPALPPNARKLNQRGEAFRVTLLDLIRDLNQLA